MKLTNPIGRNVSLNADNDINPRACMCRNGFALSSVLGDSDNCSHCGCNCWPWNHGANASTASNTDRASVLICMNNTGERLLSLLGESSLSPILSIF